MTVKESYKHGWKFDLLFGVCLVVVEIYEFTCNHKRKFSFVTWLKEGTQINATTLWDLSLKRLFGELIICAFLFSKVVAWSHYSLLGYYLEGVSSYSSKC